MEKKYIIIGLLFICVITGSYFVFNQNSTAVSDISNTNTIIENQSLQDNNNTINNNNIDKNIAVNPIKKTYNVLKDNIKINNINNTNQLTQNSGIKNSNVEYKAYLLNSENDLQDNIPKEKKLIYTDLTDRYAQCVECGGWYPIGNVTKKLPSGALHTERNCPEKHTLTDYSAFMYSDFVSRSYEEVYEDWMSHAHYDLEIIEEDDSDFNIEEQNTISDNSINNPTEETYPETNYQYSVIPYPVG